MLKLLMHRVTRRLSECGEGSSTWNWTRRRIATILRIDEWHIPTECLLYPEFDIWSPTRHRAVLWILIHVVEYGMKRDRLLTMHDYIDFLRRSKWKATNTTTRTSLTGNYLQILDEWNGASLVWWGHTGGCAEDEDTRFLSNEIQVRRKWQ
jgi:hypothetical protein